ncbi:MAG: TIGR00268 family protein, partial [Pseudomonadota bacterium]
MTNKLKRLQKILTKMGRVLIAYSGGVDSTFLLSAACSTIGNDNVLAVTALSETYPRDGLVRAKQITNKIKVNHKIIITEELKNIKFKNNPLNRCFYCKDELFGKLKSIAQGKGMVLCDASNYSDRSDYRPGRGAIRKWK